MEKQMSDGCRLDDGDRFASVTKAYYGIYACLTIILVIGSLSSWIHYRSSLIYIKKRSFTAALISGIALLINLFSGAFSNMSSSKKNFASSCVVFNTAFSTTAPLLVTTGLLSAISFYNKTNLTAALIRSTELYEGKPKQVSKRTWFLASSKFDNILFISVLFMTLSITVTYSALQCPIKNGPQKGECRIFDLDDVPILLIFTFYGIVVFLAILFINFKLKTSPDTFRILYSLRKGYGIAVFAAVIFTIVTAINFGDPENENKETVYFSYGILLDFPFIFFFVYLVPYQIYKGFRFNDVEILFQEKTIQSVLDDKDGHELLKQFLIEEFSLENMLFLDAVLNMKNKEKETNIESEILFINEKYVEHRRISLSDELFKTIERDIVNNNRNIEIYDEAYEYIISEIERESFNRFKETEKFKTYMGVGLLNRRENTFDSERNE